MKCVLFLYCALLYSSYNCVESTPVVDTVFDHYHPLSLPPYMKNYIDNLKNNDYYSKGNVFDAVRKHYEMDNGGADDLLKHTPVTKKYAKTIIFNKAAYTKTVENEIQYDFDTDISTTPSYIPVGDVYIDLEETPNIDDDIGIHKRYLSDVVLSQIQTGNSFYKSQDNEFSDEDDLDMPSGSWIS